MSGQAIYETFTKGDVAGLLYGADGLKRVASSYQSRGADLIALITTGMQQAAWQGDAANGASQEGKTLATAHDVAAPQLAKIAESMSRQAAAFEKAKNSVVPIPPMPSEPGLWANVQYPIMSNEGYEREIRAIERAIGNNIAVMAEYEEATRRNAMMLDDIPGALNPNPPQPQPSPGFPAPQPAPRWIQPPAGGGTGGTRSGGRPATNPGSSPQANSSGFTPQPSPTGFGSPGLTHADSAQSLPPGFNGAVPSPTQLPQTSGPGAAQVGGGFGPLGGGSGSGADPGRSGGSPGPRGAGTGGPGGSDGRAGGRGGIGARGLLGAEGAAGRAAAGTAGRGGGPGGMPAAGSGARGQGEEDLERERPSFLVEPDPEETFGTDQMTAPPVIGG